MNLKLAMEVIQSETEKTGHLKSEQIISDAWDGFTWPMMCNESLPGGAGRVFEGKMNKAFPILVENT